MYRDSMNSGINHHIKSLGSLISETKARLELENIGAGLGDMYYCYLGKPAKVTVHTTSIALLVNN